MFVAGTNIVDSNNPKFNTGVNYIFILKKVIYLHLSKLCILLLLFLMNKTVL